MTRTALGILLCWTLPLVAGADQFRDRVSVEPGGRLTIDLARGSVDIETNGHDEVRVEASASGFGASSFEFELESDGRDARLVGRPDAWPLGLFSPRVSVVVRVPEHYSLQVTTGGGRIGVERIDGEVDATTSGGRITVEGASGDVRLKTSGGPISAEDIIGRLEAETSGGPIRISNVKGGVDVHTSGGSITIDDVIGPVRATTSGGRISVRFDAAPEGTLETSGGSIDVEIPQGAGLELDARTSGGRVQVDTEITMSGSFRSNHIRGAINGGGPELKLRTSGGNISVGER